MRMRDSSTGLRVLFVTPAYKPYLGGVERVLEQVSAHLIDAPEIEMVGVLTTKYDFNYSPPRWRDELTDDEVLDGVHVFRRTFAPQGLPFFYHLPAGIRANVGDVLSRFRPDVIHFLFSEWFGANFSVSAQSRGCPHVFTFFYHPFSGLRAAPMNWFTRRLCQSVDIVHVVSASAADSVESAYRVAPGKIRLMPLGVSPCPPSDEIRPRHNGTDRLTILSVGRLSTSKGQLELVDVFARLVDRFGRRLRLVLAGGDGGMRDAVIARVRQVGLEDMVELPGFVDEPELRRLHANADVFCLLSMVESYGLAFLEAMSHGLPVVAYGLPPVREVLTKGALLAAPGDRSEAEELLAGLVSDDDLRARLSQEARALFEAHPTWTDVASAMVSFYEEIVPEGGRR